MTTRAVLQYCSRNLTFSRLFVGLAICLAGSCVLLTLFVLPEVYMSRARILIRTPEEKFDPYPAQTLFEKIRSRRALEPVIGKVNLTSALAKEARGKGELTAEEAYEEG